MGFSTELLTGIAEKEHITLSLVSTNWDSLFQGLQEKKYQAILSSLPPYGFNRQLYDFSDLYLPLGPVLLLPKTSPFISLEEMKEKEIGALTSSSAVLILEKYPQIFIRTYDKDALLINDLLAGKLDGVLLPLLQAESFSQGSFQMQIKIASAPLTDEGLRLITLRAEAPKLLHYFNAGLSSMKKTGTLEDLLTHWNLISLENKKI